MYLQQLTWLRGFAAFLVIVSHSLRATEVSYFEGDIPAQVTLARLFDLGTFGVLIFFVLSGCTLYISNEKYLALKQIPVFYTKRVLRIWPAYLVSLIFYILAGFLFREFYSEPQGHWIEKQFLTDFNLTDLGSYIFLIFNITGPDGLFNNAYWSLPVEFQYYILLPLIVASLRMTGMAGPCLIAILLFILPRTNLISIDNNQVFTLALSFCGGVLLGYIYKRTKYQLNPFMACCGILSTIITVMLISTGSITVPDVPYFSNLWNLYIWMAIFIVALILFSDIRLSLRLERSLSWYGKISYSTYLYHNLFIAMFVLIISNTMLITADYKFYITFLFSLISSYFIAGLSYKFVEEPFIRKGKTLRLI